MIDFNEFLPVDYLTLGEHLFVLHYRADSIFTDTGFFHHSLRRTPKLAEHQKIIPFEQWLELTEFIQAEPLSFSAVFHVSRCGSTLLMQNLKQLPSMLCLGEPNFIASSADLEQKLPQSRGMPGWLIKRMLGTWAYYARLNKKKLAVKFSSQPARQYLKLFSNTERINCLFLHRHPKFVVESLVRNPPCYLEQEALDVSESDVLQAKDSIIAAALRYQLSIEEYVALASPNFKHIGYDELAKRFIDIAEFLSGEALEANVGYSWQDSQYAKIKDSTSVPYKTICEGKVDSFAEQYEQALAPAINAYQTLESLPYEYSF